MDTSKHNPSDADMLRFWSKTIPVGEGCWTYAGAPDKDGYFRVKIKGQKFYLHRFFFELANGPIPTDRECCHTCPTRGCLNPYHMYAGTSKDNTHDSIRDGTHSCLRRIPLSPRREKHYMAKLSVEKARAIRAARASGHAVKRIMADFGFSESTVRGIISGERWAE